MQSFRLDCDNSETEISLTLQSLRMDGVGHYAPTKEIGDFPTFNMSNISGLGPS
jgi:hypothetical protein